MAKRHTEAVQHSSDSPNWRTPKALFDALSEEFHFTIDASATADVALCPDYFGPGHLERPDGLAVQWSFQVDRDAAIFLNPPYSRTRKQPIAPWVEKCWTESQAGCTIVAVLPYSPQTIWWRSWVEGCGDQRLPLLQFHAASEVRKIPHRVSFLREDGTEADNAGGNTAVVVWKPRWGKLAPWVPFSCYWEYR